MSTTSYTPRDSHFTHHQQALNSNNNASEMMDENSSSSLVIIKGEPDLTSPPQLASPGTNKTLHHHHQALPGSPKRSPDSTFTLPSSSQLPPPPPLMTLGASNGGGCFHHHQQQYHQHLNLITPSNNGGESFSSVATSKFSSFDHHRRRADSCGGGGSMFPHQQRSSSNIYYSPMVHHHHHHQHNQYTSATTSNGSVNYHHQSSPVKQPSSVSRTPTAAVAPPLNPNANNNNMNLNNESSVVANNNKKASSRRNPWGSETYSDLISIAIRSYPDQQATLQQIYDFIIGHYDYFHERSDSVSSAGWKNSIRHNLSLHDRFVKCPKASDNTKSSYWRINQEVVAKPYLRRRHPPPPTSSSGKTAKRASQPKQSSSRKSSTVTSNRPPRKTSEVQGRTATDSPSAHLYGQQQSVGIRPPHYPLPAQGSTAANQWLYSSSVNGPVEIDFCRSGGLQSSARQQYNINCRASGLIEQLLSDNLGNFVSSNTTNDQQQSLIPQNQSLAVADSSHSNSLPSTVAYRHHQQFHLPPLPLHQHSQRSNSMTIDPPAWQPAAAAAAYLDATTSICNEQYSSVGAFTDLLLSAGGNLPNAGRSATPQANSTTGSTVSQGFLPTSSPNTPPPALLVEWPPNVGNMTIAGRCMTTTDQACDYMKVEEASESASTTTAAPGPTLNVEAADDRLELEMSLELANRIVASTRTSC